MRFLLLCPVALLLLTAPAKTIELDSVEVPDNNSTATESARSEPSPTTPATASAEVESVSASTERPGKSTTVKPDKPDPKEVRRLKRRLAKAQAEFNSLTEENKILTANYNTIHTERNRLMRKWSDLVGILWNTRRRLAAARVKLNSQQEELCKPSQSELAKLIDEETSIQLGKRKAEVERSYEKQFEDISRDLRLKIRKELLLLDSHSPSKSKS